MEPSSCTQNNGQEAAPEPHTYLVTRPGESSEPRGDDQCRKTAKLFLKRHAVPFRYFRRLQQALVRRGFVVKNIRRLEEHPCWELSLRVGSAPDGRNPRAIRRYVAESLCELGHHCPPKEVEVIVERDRLKVSFIWPLGQAAWLNFEDEAYQEIKVEDDNGERPDGRLATFRAER